MQASIAIVNPQGGSGKTFTGLMLAYFFGQSQKKVLFVDTDPMAVASHMLFPFDVKNDLHDALNDKISIKKAIVETILPNVYLAPSSHRLIGFELDKLNTPKREHILKKKLSNVAKDYDVIITDTPSSLGLLTISAMSAANKVIIPIISSEFTFLPIAQMIKTIKVIQSHVNKDLTIKGILVNLLGNPVYENQEDFINLKNCFYGLVFDTVVFWDEKLPKMENIQHIATTMDSRTYNSYAAFYKELIS